MKIAVISDSHDNLANIEKTVDILKKEKIEMLLHCGDICSPATLMEILKRFPRKVHIVFGNVDGDYFRTAKISLDKFPNLKIWENVGEIKIGKRKIAFTHLPESAEALAASQKYDFVFYGHTHKPWQEEIGKTKLVNPGNLAGMFYRATFAVYDAKTGRLRLKILNGPK